MANRTRANSTIWLFALAVLTGLIGAGVASPRVFEKTSAGPIVHHVHVHTHNGSTHTHTHTHHHPSPAQEPDSGCCVEIGDCADEDHHCCGSCEHGHSVPVFASVPTIPHWRDLDQITTVCVLAQEAEAFRREFASPAEPPPPRAGPPPHLRALRTVVLLT
ncbi:MAG: hypothetical protein RLN60_00720 [Phycisphaerales bacterium]